MCMHVKLVTEFIKKNMNLIFVLEIFNLCRLLFFVPCKKM